MGRIDIMKGVSGKVGPVVTYVRKDGTQVVRAYAKPGNPQTPKQMANRARFALVNKELSPLSSAIKRGHLSKPNAFSKVIGQACREAVAGDYPDIYLDFSKVQIAAGTLSLPANVRAEHNPLTRTLSISWDTRPVHASHSGSDSDKVNIVCYNSAIPYAVQTLTRGTRAEGKATLELAEEWRPETAHFWLYLISGDLAHSSDSIYLRPE